MLVGSVAVSSWALAQGMGGMPAGPAGNDYARDAMAAHQKMTQAMQMMPSNDPDKDFATMMTAHHQGAIDMAGVQLKYGKDPELRMLATAIIADQTREIEQLRAWLARSPRPAMN